MSKLSLLVLLASAGLTNAQSVQLARSYTGESFLSGFGECQPLPLSLRSGVIALLVSRQRADDGSRSPYYPTQISTPRMIPQTAMSTTSRRPRRAPAISSGPTPRTLRCRSTRQRLLRPAEAATLSGSSARTPSLTACMCSTLITSPLAAVLGLLSGPRRAPAGPSESAPFV